MHGTTLFEGLSAWGGITASLVGIPSLASFYTWADGPWLVVFWILTIFADLTASILIGGMSAELSKAAWRMRNGQSSSCTPR